MKLSSFTGNVFSRVSADELDTELYTYLPNAKTYSNPKNNRVVFGSTNMYTGRYKKLDAPIPAVAYVKLSIADKGIFITSEVPPKYVQSFSCTRVSTQVGKFELSIVVPVNTFDPVTDDLTIRLANLIGCVDAAKTGAQGDINGYACSLEYGWRGSSSNSVIRYDEAGIYGMELSYTDSYYQYKISGLINQNPTIAHSVASKTLSVEELQSKIDENTLSEGSKNIISAFVEIPAGITQYKRVARNNEGRAPGAGISYDWYEDGTVPETFTIRNVTWDEDERYINSGEHWYYCKDVNITTKPNTETTESSETDDESAPTTPANTDRTTPVADAGTVDFLFVEAGQRVSEKVELLAKYLYGDHYEVEVDHTDDEYAESKRITSIVSEINVSDTKNDGETGTDKNANIINESTTSWHTWLAHMVSACQDTSQSTSYSDYSKYDTNKDGLLVETDFNALENYDGTTTVNTWKKYSIDLNTDKKLTETEFNSKYKEPAWVPGSPDISNMPTLTPGYISPTTNIATMPAPTQQVKKSKTYAEYSADYDTHQLATDYTADKGAINELIDTYDGGIRQGAAIQFYMHFMDAAAGKPAKLYIGPEKNDDATYDYVVGNHAKDSTVISFDLSEDMVWLISAAKSYLSANDGGRYTIDPATGSTVRTALSTEASQMYTDESYANMVANKILENVSSAQVSAKLTVVSDIMSRTIQTTDHVRVKVKTNGGKTMFSGVYTVLGVDDSISDSGVLSSTLDLRFTQSQAFDTLKNIILNHLSTAKAASKTSATN